jgi:hypothetical protein
MEGRPFVLLGVNTDEDREGIRRVIHKKQLNWRSWWNGPDGTDGPISRDWDVHRFPTIYLIDHQGIIRAHQPRDLEETVEKLVQEAERAGS